MNSKPSSRAKKRRPWWKTALLLLLFPIYAGVGVGYVWLSAAFVYALSAGLPAAFQIICVILGVAASIYVLAYFGKSFKRKSTGTIWLRFASVGAFFSLSPMLVHAVRGAGEATFRSPSTLTGAGGGIINVETYAQFAITWGVLVAVAGLIGWGRALVRAKN